MADTTLQQIRRWADVEVEREGAHASLSALLDAFPTAADVEAVARELSPLRLCGPGREPCDADREVAHRVLAALGSRTEDKR